MNAAQLRPAAPGDVPGLEVDRAALQAFVAANVAGAASQPQVQWRLLSGGRSNLTFAIEVDGRPLILRRPPIGHQDARSHDVLREYRFLCALRDSAVPVPGPVAWCEDPGVFGAPFYLMERKPGAPLETASASPHIAENGRIRDIVLEMVDAMARLHEVDWRAAGLSDLGRPDGYLERQVRRWTERRATQRSRPMPALDELGRRMASALPHVPRCEAPTIVHGDFNLGNLLVSTTPPYRIEAVLDWEMATIGDPLMDLGVMLAYTGPHMGEIFEVPDPVSGLPGFPSREDLVAAYARRSGRAVEHVAFYHCLALFKILVLIEEGRERYRQGHTRGDGHARLGERTPATAEAALGYARASGLPGLA